MPTIKKNLYPSWNKIKPTNFIKSHNNETHTVTFKNGSQIVFFPESFATDKDQDRWKGLEMNGFGFEEINECQEITLGKAFERAGSWIIPDIETQPKPIVVATCNPTQGWFKEKVYTPWKNGTLKPTWLYIQARIYDNIPLLEAQPDYLQNLKDNLNRYEYEVFVEGNWDVQLKTGGEFLRAFELSQHVKPVRYNLDVPIRISIDSNVYPYIAMTAWQWVKDGDTWIIRLIEEIIAADPENTASLACKKIIKYLKSINYSQKLYLHGDKSTKNRNNIDDNKRSFFQIINEGLIDAGYNTQDCMPVSMPPVAAVGDFVNAIFSQEVKFSRIEIGEHCKTAINDFIETKTDKDGTILKVRVTDPKTKVSYEPHAHIVDNLKDVIVQVHAAEFIAYINRHNKLIPGGITSVSRMPKVTY